MKKTELVEWRGQYQEAYIAAEELARYLHGMWNW